MNFNSIEFAIFLPFVLLVCALLQRRVLATQVFLLIASYFFYMSWNWKYAGLMLWSTVLDYVLARMMAAEDDVAKRRRLLIVSLATNLGLLAIFKYYNFFIDTSGDVAGLFGWTMDPTALHIRVLLPVGISFYTFQTLSYTIDVYRRDIPAERDFLKFALFVSFFPQLVAGPIVRARDFIPQLYGARHVTTTQFHSGLLLVFRGLFKKIVIADMLAALAVDNVFADPSAFSSVTLLLALYGYAFQIYNDFSGYSDIAIGSARMLGYDLTKNFDRPYLARNIREFWTRWHISLSTWLRDYLYIPLGGNRGTAGRVRANLLITMLLGGLWHGAALNFVLWGLWHGVLLIMARGVTRRPSGEVSDLQVWRQRIVTFHLVLFGWLLFRVQSWDQFESYTVGLLDFTGGLQVSNTYLAILALAVLLHIVPVRAVEEAAERFTAQPRPVQAAVYAVAMLIFTAFTLGAPAFIYFQF